MLSAKRLIFNFLERNSGKAFVTLLVFFSGGGFDYNPDTQFVSFGKQSKNRAGFLPKAANSRPQHRHGLCTSDSTAAHSETSKRRNTLGGKALGTVGLCLASAFSQFYRFCNQLDQCWKCRKNSTDKGASLYFLILKKQPNKTTTNKQRFPWISLEKIVKDKGVYRCSHKHYRGVEYSQESYVRKTRVCQIQLFNS